MLEGLAAWVLNNYVGKYVENLNTNQLSVGLLQGQVELEDLPLKKEAFRQILFPLEIKNGFIGKILLNIPVTRLRTDPWVITIERLYVVLGPVPLDQYNGDLYEEIAENAKLCKLDAFEAEWKNCRLNREASSSYYSYSYSSWLSYGSSVMTSIISSLQLKIQDIHIRYEDQVDGRSFAWGLMIKSAKSEQHHEQSTGSYVSQALQLKGVSIYWDVDALHIGGADLQRMANSMENLRNFCVRSNETSCEHNFLLSTPEGAQVLLSRNSSERPLRSRNEPRIKCNLTLSQLPIIITDAQYRQMVKSVQNVEIKHKHWKYRKWKPSVPVKQNAKEWWIFATKASTELLMKRRSQQTISYAYERAKDLNIYVKIYHKHLMEDALTSQEAEDKERIESGYDFETLLNIREVVMKRIDDAQNKVMNSPVTPPGETGEAQSGGGLLQYLFPGWSGWSGGGASTMETSQEIATLEERQGSVSPSATTGVSDLSDSASFADTMSTNMSIPASQFEEELIAALNRLDDEHYLLRDATLAHVTFNLKSCTVTLQSQSGTSLRELVHLKVDDVSAQLKSHPRAKSYLIHAKIGCVQFVDKMLPNTVYSHLVAPHIISDTALSYRPGAKISASDLFRPRSAGATAVPLSAISTEVNPLFEVLYEKNPGGSLADHKLVVNTQSLDIVYSQTTVQSLKDFFTLKNQISMENAMQQLEYLKRETKSSLKEKVDAMLTGNQIIQRWDICLDICAPQIIMPESFTDKMSTAVMFDLGRLQFKNLASFEKPKPDRRKSTNEDIDEDDEDFQTPYSTPPGEDDSISALAGAAVSPAQNFSKSVTSPPPMLDHSAVSDVDFRDRMYDKYSLNLQDMQVMVTTCSRESWKFAQLRGSSHLHVIDRFNISLKFERRLLYTEDPQFPSVIVHAQLPKLVVHISDQKVSALSTCLRGLIAADANTETTFNMDPEGGLPAGGMHSNCNTNHRRRSQTNDDSVLFLGKFVIDQMHCELQSQGKCLAELQVHGVEMTHSKHPKMQSIQLLVQGLLLVDAIQTHGPDFDLLLASHKHITMDSKSGSIRDSEPNSPISPASPKSHYCVTPPQMSTSTEVTVLKPNMLTSLLASLHKTIAPSGYGSPSSSSHQNLHVAPRGDISSPIPLFPTDSDNNNSDALIVVELVWTQRDSDENDSNEVTDNLVVHVGFNNLDVIANQETIVELVSFVQCVAKASKGRYNESMNEYPVAEENKFQASSININFDFNRLNILLLRSSSSDKHSSPGKLKLATATLSGAKIDAVLSEHLDLKVVLGGVQVCDLLAGDATKNNYVVNVGVNPDDDLVTKLGKQLYNNEASALVLQVKREYPETVDWTSTIKRTPAKVKRNKKNKNTLSVDLHLGSVVYTHSSRLIDEVTCCAIEFKQYVAKLAASLKSAATEVAKGIVGSELPIQDQLNIKLSVILETPVIVIPCVASAPNVLVANLGRIAVHSLSMDNYKLELSNTSLYSYDTSLDPGATYDCTQHGKPILHNTLIELFLSRVSKNNSMTILTNNDGRHDGEVWQLQGQIVGPLKVALTKSQFGQIIDTLNEITSASKRPERNNMSNGGKGHDIDDNDNVDHRENMDKYLETENVKYRVKFGVEEFIVEFCEEQGKPFVSVAFQEFLLELSSHSSQSLMNMSLHGLVMEDLYEEQCSKHRILISSHQIPKSSPSRTRESSNAPTSSATSAAIPIKSNDKPLRCDYLSSSCPSFSDAMPEVNIAYGQSLPDILCTRNIFMMNFKKHSGNRSRCRRGKDECTPTDTSMATCCCPQTPPPSPTPSLPADNIPDENFPEGTLVEISICSDQGKSVNTRTIHVDVNCLTMCVNVRPWVMVLDLISRPGHSPQQTVMKVDDHDSAVVHTSLEMSVQNFTMQLNTTNYEICEVQVRQLWFKSQMGASGNNVMGRLGKMLIYDLTPFGSKVYQERFVTSGNEALHFKFTCSGDVYNLECNMTSVLVVHTHLFLCEILNFVAEFSQVQELLARMQHQLVPVPQQKPKIDLKVTAGSPVIVIPRNSHSGDSLVLNLGSFTVSTVFEQTLCLNQVMQLVLCQMEMYCGVLEREPHKNSGLPRRKHSQTLSSLFPSFNIRRKGASLLDEKFELQLKVVRNLDSEITHIEPDFSVKGHVSQATISLDKEQFDLVSGILFENLSEGVHLQTSSVIPQPVFNQDDAWVNMSIVLDLYNVTLNLMTDRKSDKGLAKIEFIDSKLSVCTLTDGRKDVDLVSQEIRIYDIRYNGMAKKPNVFTDMLLPTHSAERRGLQMELHYRTFPNQLTILLNNMRLMSIFDWFKQVAAFLAIEQQTVTSGDQEEGVEAARVYYSENPPDGTNPMDIHLKVSMTDTEVVVVEDPSSSDSNAVILKSTAVLTWHGKTRLERPLCCQLQNLEVFSCVLGREEDTALSIIDPASVSLEMNQRSASLYELELSSQQLFIRLSYNDMKMFQNILKRLPKQAGPLSQTEQNINQLKELGFAHNDCVIALRNCQGRIDDAALWLTTNAKPLQVRNILTICQLPVNLATIRISDFRLCFIDDCGDADVPLFELRLHDTDAQVQLDRKNLDAQSSFRIDYYNRILSGWEPLVEPIVLRMNWHLTSKHVCSIETDGQFNINVTSALVDITERVSSSWQRDDSSVVDSRRRTPFVPFALKNSLGCRLEFATITTIPNSTSCGIGSDDLLNGQELKFNQVPIGAIVPFQFNTQGKLRHQESHQLLIRQIIVRIEGCHQMDAISVEKVGEYFRYVRPSGSSHASVARVVFSISLQGSALKVIDVKSAFVIKNQSHETLDMSITTCTPTGSSQTIGNQNITISGKAVTSLPFAFDYTSLQVRPKRDDKLLFAELGWKGATEAIPVFGMQSQCSGLQRTAPFWFAVTIRRENFRQLLFNEAEKHAPGHTLVICAPIKLYNLLPMELHYRIEMPIHEYGILKSRNNTAFHQINTDKQTVVFEFILDGFICSNKLVLEPGCGSTVYFIELKDSDQKSLFLRVNVSVDPAGAYKIYVSAPYWLINRTGLPLIFKQEDVSQEAAGQPPELESARSVAPLLFSFVNNEAPQLCTMRVGNKLHDRFTPKWCHPFSLDSRVSICKLHLASHDNSPDRVYNIGIYSQQGKGLYKDTQYVVFSPLFLLVNNTNITLDFAQKFATRGKYESLITSAMPKSSVAFHWPRVDLDPLLCIKTDSSLWSGGFSIDKPMSSTHIHIRTKAMQSMFVLAEVRQHYGTFIVTFTQPETVPSPMRIENLSEVSITFSQTGIVEEARRYTVKAKTSMPYAWDEPTERTFITVAAPGGTQEMYDMSTFKEGNRLYYENFFYIAFTGTFLEPRPAVAQKSNRDIKSEELVLDVTQQRNVVINRKAPGARSQLWRMTADRMLQHEGSSTPLDPRLPLERQQQAGATRRVFVLDIQDIGADPHNYVPLVLRKPDPRRRSLQTWTFTPDGRLRCDIENLFVQARGGLQGLRKGNDVVLGPERPPVSPLDELYLPRSKVPYHAGIGIQKMRGGSGVLSVRVVLDGPTIVLRVSDITSSDSSLEYHTLALANPMYPANNPLMLYQNKPASHSEQGRNEPMQTGKDVQVRIQLPQVGISLIQGSEEVLLFTLEQVLLSFYQGDGAQQFDATIRKLQIDNMLSDAERPSALYMNHEGSKDLSSQMPAVSINARRLINYNTDTLVFDHFLVKLRDTTLALEEKLMLNIFQMFYNLLPFLSDLDDNLIEQRSVAADVLREYERKLYFNMLRIDKLSVKLSVLPARTGTLDESLKSIKKQVGWSLIRFEDAPVTLSEFEKHHPFETMSFLVGTASAHYSNELKKQARTILGNVDFFGSPFGFLEDVKGGFKEMINEKNPLTFIKSITHGASNSMTKLTGSLSEGLRNIANIEEQGAVVLAGPSVSSRQHVMGGLRGLGKGFFDGFTGLILHPYHGLTTNGIQGLVEGVGKGLMGSVAVPTVGALDFATGITAAIRDTSKVHERPDRKRPMRLCCGPRGLLPCYSPTLASGQMQLYKLKSKNATSPSAMASVTNEYFLFALPLPDGVQLMVSDQRILKISPNRQSIIDVYHLSELINAYLLTTLNCVSLVLRMTDHEMNRIDCGDPDEVDLKACNEMVQCINYAIYTYTEKSYAISIIPDAE